MKDKLTIATAFDNTIRIYVCNSTNTLKRMQKNHDMWPTASAALGRAMTVAAMMTNMNKNKERTLITIDGGGPIGKMFVETDTTGVLKGYVSNPKVYFKYESGPKKGKLNVGMAVGINGFLTVTRDLGLKEPFTSNIPLQTGEIGEDFAYFFTASEQVPSAVSVGVLVDVDYSIKASGGFIIQVMPGATEETLTSLELVLSTLDSCSSMIDFGYTNNDILAKISNDYSILLEKEFDYKCDCSKQSFKKGIETIGKNKISEILKEDGTIKTECHFCNSEYIFNEEDFK